jgi:carbon storage regulator CsrA
MSGQIKRLNQSAAILDAIRNQGGNSDNFGANRSTAHCAAPVCDRSRAEANPDQPRLSCEIQDGIPIVRGASSSYYIFNQKGQRLLILTRKRNESIIIDNSIDIVVLEINRDEVKLGIICPENTPVRCKEASKERAAFPLPR